MYTKDVLTVTSCEVKLQNYSQFPRILIFLDTKENVSQIYCDNS